jgi:hypothetical protein
LEPTVVEKETQMKKETYHVASGDEVYIKAGKFSIAIIPTEDPAKIIVDICAVDGELEEGPKAWTVENQLLTLGFNIVSDSEFLSIVH